MMLTDFLAFYAPEILKTFEIRNTLCPVTFCTKTVALFHQTLDGKTRKLFQGTQITKMCYDCLIIFFLQETLKTELNLSLNGNMLFKLFRISSLQKNIIFLMLSATRITRMWLLSIIPTAVRIQVITPAQFSSAFASLKVLRISSLVIRVVFCQLFIGY